MLKPAFLRRRVAKTFAVFVTGLQLSACSTLSVARYEPNDAIREVVRRAPGLYSAGSVSGETRVQSDMLVKASLPCRLTGFEMPDHEPVSIYIQKALHAELMHSEKLAAPEGRRIDIVVNKIESDTSKIHDGTWTLEFAYKLGKMTTTIATTTRYAFAADSTTACRNTADAFNEALRENFAKFFSAL